MTPDQVPDDLVAAAFDGLNAAADRYPSDEGIPTAVAIRAALAAVLPAHEQLVRAQLAAQLREAAVDDPDGVDPLAAAIWDHCERDETGGTWDDPRSIATVAYRWLADHLEGDA